MRWNQYYEIQDGALEQFAGGDGSDLAVIKEELDRLDREMYNLINKIKVTPVYARMPLLEQADMMSSAFLALSEAYEKQAADYAAAQAQKVKKWYRLW